MRDLQELLDAKEWLSLNAKLQNKKNKLRADLKGKGVIKKDAENKFDRYTYLSESGYKELATELLAKNGLDLSYTELEYIHGEGSEKQNNCREVKLEFCLSDIDTGFYELTIVTGEALDKGDKAGYKAYTGAMKYYLANTFLVATGDDAERESPSEKIKDTPRVNDTTKSVRLLTELQKKRILTLAGEERLNAKLSQLGLSSIDAMTVNQASDFIKEINNK